MAAAGSRSRRRSKPDGTFDSSDGEGRLQGQVTDGTLEMTIASQYCEHRWTMHLIP